MSQPKHSMHRSASIVPLGKVSIKGIQSALTHFHEDTAQDPTQIGLTSVDYAIIDRAINGIANSGTACQIENPVTGTVVTISIWPSGVTSGNAALSGFGRE
jgi:hypothetical protein